MSLHKANINHTGSAYKPAGYIKAAGSYSSGRVKKKCAGCEQEDKENIRMKPFIDNITRLSRKESGGSGSTANPNVEININHTKGSGSKLSEGTRSFIESRFGADFSGVNIHTGSESVQMNRELNAQAFTVGNDVHFNQGKYNPSSDSGKHLLAHELTHTIQQGGGGRALQKKNGDEYWDIAVRGRELEKVPSNFNYELVEDKLIAHITGASDIDAVVELIEILNLYEGVITDNSKIKKEFLEASKSTKDLDITKHLPPNIKLFMKRMKAIYADIKKYAESKGSKDKPVTPTTIKKEMKAQGKKDKEIKGATRKWVGGLYSNIKTWKEFVTVCHTFVSMTTSSVPGGHEPGKFSSSYTGALDFDDDKISGMLNQSVKGKGPYRIVSRSSVKPGDIAVFGSGKNIRGEGNLITIAKGEAIHSAVVIKVSGKSYKDIEILEKKNPWEIMGTRTVKEILDYYSSNKPKVTFLSPTLSGMPGKNEKQIGKKPPSEPFTKSTGKAPENTHVLFKIDSILTLPHEDRKLFKFIAEKKKPPKVRVHGYASEDGAEDYNFNLSAHRAVSLKKALRGHFPSGTDIEAFAYGETDEFGEAKKNRRAGVERK